MDEMKITSKFLTGVISKLLERILKQKLGYRIDIRLNAVRVTLGEDGKLHAHLDAECEMDKSELAKILKAD